jgi:hypothetical protein
MHSFYHKKIGELQVGGKEDPRVSKEADYA